jgi:hypothetical protein
VAATGIVAFGANEAVGFQTGFAYEHTGSTDAGWATMLSAIRAIDITEVPAGTAYLLGKAVFEIS